MKAILARAANVVARNAASGAEKTWSGWLGPTHSLRREMRASIIANWARAPPQLRWGDVAGWLAVVLEVERCGGAGELSF